MTIQVALFVLYIGLICVVYSMHTYIGTQTLSWLIIKTTYALLKSITQFWWNNIFECCSVQSSISVFCEVVSQHLQHNWIMYTIVVFAAYINQLCVFLFFLIDYCESLLCCQFCNFQIHDYILSYDLLLMYNKHDIINLRRLSFSSRCPDN